MSQTMTIETDLNGVPGVQLPQSVGVYFRTPRSAWQGHVAVDEDDRRSCICNSCCEKKHEGMESCDC